jgi:hypothetical protein
LATWQNGAYLISGDIWLCLSYDTNTKDAAPNEYTHVAFNIHLNDFPKIKSLISQHHIEVWKENTSEGDSIYILDPDFNKLEIHASSLLDRLWHIRNHPYQNMKINESIASILMQDGK